MTTPALTLTMTTAGLGRFTAAQASDDIDLTIATVGITASVFTVAPTLTALPGEFRRLATVSGSAVGDNIVHMIVRDEAALAYEIRGFGLFLKDGTLFAVYGQAGPIAGKSAVATLLFALDIAFPTADIAQLTFGDTNFLNPPATTEAKGVVEMATLAEAKARDGTRAVTGAIVDAMITTALPIGSITLWFGDAAPPGWAICNGQKVARSDGAGDITTPDLRGRAPVGVSDDHALGSAFGATSKTVQTASGQASLQVDATFKNDTAGGGSDKTVKTVAVTDQGHSHGVTIDVTPPSLALLFIMKV